MKRSTMVGLGVGAGVGLGLGLVLLDGGRFATGPKSNAAPKPARDGCPARLEARGEAKGIRYRAFTPAGVCAHPVVLMHGRGGSEDVMFEALADVQIAAPQVYPRAPSRFGARMRAWTKARSTDHDWPEAQAEAVEQLRPFIAWLSRCFGRPVVAGHSQGAHMAFGMAAAYPELLRAAVGASGALTPALWGHLGVPVVAVHGVDDHTVPIGNARLMADELGAELVEVAGGHGFFDGVRQAFLDALSRLSSCPT